MDIMEISTKKSVRQYNKLMACASSITMHHMFCLRFDNGDKLGIENPIQISQNKKKRKKRTKGELNFVFGNSPVVMFNLECNL